MKIFSTAFLAIVLLIISVPAQRSDVLINGEPPLTRLMVDRVAGLMEWSLDTQLSQDDRSALQSAIVGYWKNSERKSIQSIIDILVFEQKIEQASDADKRNLQPQVKASLLKAFEQEPSDPMNQVLLGAYRRSQNVSLSGGSSGTLTGRWQVSHMNSVTTQNVYTGAIGDANGMIAEFDIKPDGRVIYSFYMSQVNYGCTTKIKTSKTGRAVVNGSRVTFAYDSGTTKSEDSCNSRYNYTKDLGRTSDVYDFSLKMENGKKQFCFADAKLKDCAIKLN